MSSARIFRQIVVIIPAFMMAFISGMEYAWVATNMPFLQSTRMEIPYTNRQCTVLAVLLPIGRMSTIFGNTLLFGKFGRKPPLVLSALLFLVSSGIIVATKIYLAIAFTRFLHGMAIGIFDCFSSIYVGEVAMKNIRGTLSSCVTAFFNFGVISQYVIGFYLSYDDAAIITVTLAVLTMLSTYYLIESPYYLTMNNQTDKALKVLVRLHAIDVKIAEKELKEISKNQTASLANLFKYFKKPEIYKSFAITLSLGFLTTILTTTFISFANFIIPDSKFLNSEHFAIFLNAIPTVMSVLSALCIDHLGRRALLLVGYSAGFFLNTIITLLYYIEEKTLLTIPNFSLIIFGLIGLLLIISSLCINPPVSALRTELFPITHKILGLSCSIALNSMALFLTTFFFMQVAMEYGIHLNFLLYCICCVIGLVFVSYLLPYYLREGTVDENFQKLSLSVPVCIISLLAGMSFVWAASSFKALRSSEDGAPFTLTECTMTASCIYFGRMTAPVIGIFILGKLGRKVPLVVSAVSLFIGSIALILPKTPILVYVSRLIFGFGTGTYTPFCNMYVGEISSKDVRGIFATLYVTFYDLGSLLQFFFGWYISYKMTAVITAALSASAVLSTYFLIESPFFLQSIGKKEKAYEILCYLRDDEGKNVANELQDTRTINAASNLREFVSNFKRPEVYKSFIVVTVLGVIAALLMTITISFANYLVPNSNYISGDCFAMILCFIPVWASLFSTFFIEKYGRRVLLMGSFIILGFLTAVISVLFYIDERTSFKIPHLSLILATVILLFVTIFSFSMYPTVIAIRSEMFPPAYKVFGTNMSIWFNSFTSLFSTVVFMKLNELNLIYVVFVSFTLTCQLAIVFTYFIIPETKGKTLNEIQRILRGEK